MRVNTTWATGSCMLKLPPPDLEGPGEVDGGRAAGDRTPKRLAPPRICIVTPIWAAARCGPANKAFMAAVGTVASAEAGVPAMAIFSSSTK